MHRYTHVSSLALLTIAALTAALTAQGTPIGFEETYALSTDRTKIICATHGAEFRIDTGECTRGPCLGDHLEQVMIEIRDGTVLVPDDAGL